LWCAAGPTLRNRFRMSLVAKPEAAAWLSGTEPFGSTISALVSSPRLRALPAEALGYRRMGCVCWPTDTNTGTETLCRSGE
jgi:hypothetical protein